MMVGDAPPRFIDVRSAGEVMQGALLHAEQYESARYPAKGIGAG